ncbi:MAG: metal-sensitive transcriptional regulator [Chloroflexi bacterium]|nr:metal-sensitive transcriptional regulator [Chloroflexota bacterium]
MQQKETVVRRLKTIEGHIRGISRMVEEDTYCVDVLNQINAVQASLNKISNLILDDHLRHCLTTAVRGDNPEDTERVLKEITQLFEAATKV